MTNTAPEADLRVAVAELEEATEAGDLVRLKAAIALHGAAAEETDALYHAKQAMTRLLEERKVGAL